MFSVFALSMAKNAVFKAHFCRFLKGFYALLGSFFGCAVFASIFAAFYTVFRAVFVYGILGAKAS